MKIQQVSERTGLSIHTLRYYEQAGLVTAIGRASSGHRDYSEGDVYSIIFVTKLRAAGMPIADIKRYVDLAQLGNSTTRERLQLLEEHKMAIERKINELCQHLEVINSKIAHYREHMNQRQESVCIAVAPASA